MSTHFNVILRLASKQNRLFCSQWLLKKNMSTSGGKDHLQRTALNSRNENIAQADVIGIQDLSSSVKLLKLHISDKQFTFKAGQWVDMFIPGLDTVGGFSMSSPPHLLTESSILHLAIKYAKHPPAFWVHTKCQVGSAVHLRVGGDFYFDPLSESEPRDLLLLAGGVGVNPLYSMLQHFVHCQKVEGHTGVQGRSAQMLYSAKNKKDLIFKDELLDIAQATKNVQVRLFSSKEKSEDTEVFSYVRIQESHIKSALSSQNPQQTSVYLCGPLPFIEAMRDHCVRLDVPADNIYFERWW